jgi:hypothetical protein
MRRFLSGAFALTATLCTMNLAVADDAMGGKMGAMTTDTVKLAAQNGSGESGTATLTQGADGLTVKLDLTGGSGDQPAHIHKGTCAKLDPAPAFPLETVSDGKSTTLLKNVKLSELMSGTYAINVHKSTADLKDYVACGDLKMAAM